MLACVVWQREGTSRDETRRDETRMMSGRWALTWLAVLLLVAAVHGSAADAAEDDSAPVMFVVHLREGVDASELASRHQYGSFSTSLLCPMPVATR